MLSDSCLAAMQSVSALDNCNQTTMGSIFRNEKFWGMQSQKPGQAEAKQNRQQQGKKGKYIPLAECV